MDRGAWWGVHGVTRVGCEKGTDTHIHSNHKSSLCHCCLLVVHAVVTQHTPRADLGNQTS